ncbi:DegT/DnrJ/EryC1/StrS family aminotransferase [Candidatus Uhrbacteria bacterium]|nr:DegT/DnrJ/EryC1/StrS family aminotransferase [Candidatus Uhrbacteria bacterium]
MITLYPGYKRGFGTLQSFLSGYRSATGVDLYPFSCARAAMVFGLRALGFQRNDETYVPPFLGHCVLSALARTAFPARIPSKRTRAILVYHQFGFPQRIDRIEALAKKKKWIIINNMANTLFSQYRGEYLMGWGDLSVVSLSKLFPCAMGGGIVSRNSAIWKSWTTASRQDQGVQRVWVEKAHRILRQYHRKHKKEDSIGDVSYDIEGVYGYLPELIPFPDCSAGSLPQTTKELLCEGQRRRTLWWIAQEMLPHRVPHCDDSDIVPFAIPIQGSQNELKEWSRSIWEDCRVVVPLLHFDWNRNMVEPDYRLSLAVGCHAQWTETIVRRICAIIRSRAH